MTLIHFSLVHTRSHIHSRIRSFFSFFFFFRDKRKKKLEGGRKTNQLSTKRYLQYVSYKYKRGNVTWNVGLNDRKSETDPSSTTKGSYVIRTSSWISFSFSVLCRIIVCNFRLFVVFGDKGKILCKYCTKITIIIQNVSKRMLWVVTMTIVFGP